MHEEALEVMPDLPKFEKDAEAEKKLREFLRQFLLTSRKSVNHCTSIFYFKVKKNVGVKRSCVFLVPDSYVSYVCFEQSLSPRFPLVHVISKGDSSPSIVFGPGQCQTEQGMHENQGLVVLGCCCR